MYTASDYLDLSPAAAREQWRAIQARKPVDGRQVPFVPVETVLCFAASWVVNHRRYGGSTSERAEEPVPSLARQFRRRNSSVLAKMANLDGSRKNGAKSEIEVAAQLIASPRDVRDLYLVIFAAARAVGVGPEDLPDFLELEGGSELYLLGQQELDQSTIEVAVDADAKKWTAERPDLGATVTERLLVGVARLGQHRFAAEVMSNHGYRCVFCGLGLAVDGRRARRMLVASHIKPWSDSSSKERLDAHNGLTACPTHDVAFDTGLVTVDLEFAIHVRPEVAVAAHSQPEVAAVFGRPPLADRLLLPDAARVPRREYLEWHHAHVYTG